MLENNTDDNEYDLHRAMIEESSKKEDQRIKANERSAEYRAKNPEKARKQQSTYYKNGRKFVPETGRTIQKMKNGILRKKPVETKHTEELGTIILHLVLMGHPLELIAKGVGIDKKTIQNWKNPDSKSYIESFAQKFDTAYQRSAEVLFSHIRKVMDDSSGDMYEDNKSGSSVSRPNNANVQRSKLILDKLFRMIRIRQHAISKYGRDTMVITILNFGTSPTPEELKEANVSNSQPDTQKQISG